MIILYSLSRHIRRHGVPGILFTRNRITPCSSDDTRTLLSALTEPKDHDDSPECFELLRFSYEYQGRRKDGVNQLFSLVVILAQVGVPFSNWNRKGMISKRSAKFLAAGSVIREHHERVFYFILKTCLLIFI